eukprot:s5128_g3.t1
MIMCFPYDVAAPSLSQGCASEQLFSGTSRKVQLYVGGPDVGLDFTDQPAPAPDIPPQPSAAGEEVDYPGYEDPHGDMPVDGEDTPPPQGQQPEPDLDDDPTELDTGGDPPSQPPEAALRCRYREVNTMTQICICFTCHRQMNRRFRVLSPPMPWPAPPSPIAPVPIPPHPHFPVPQSLRPPSPAGNVSQTRARGTHPGDMSKAKSRTVAGPPVVLLPGQSAGKKDPLMTSRFLLSLFLRRLAAEDTDSDATVDYRETGLLALAAGDDDVLIRLPSDFDIPSFVPLDGDGFASWLTKQDRIKAGTLTPEMQRKYATEIRAAKLEEFKSYLDNDAIRLTDRRKLGRDVNFLTGRWVLTVKVDKNGYKARWVCRGFQDKFAWDQQTDSPTATRYGFRLVAKCAANHIGIFSS